MQKLSAEFALHVRNKSTEQKYKDVPFEPWGCEVRLKRLTAGECMAITKQHGDEDGEGNVKVSDEHELDFMAAVLAKSIVDEHDQRLFDSPEGVAFLREEPMGLLALAMVAFDLSGLSVKRDAEDDDAKKN